MIDVRQRLDVDADRLGGDASETRQLGFRELTYRRFLAHPAAKWALLGLAIIVVACYGAPLWHALFPGFVQAPSGFTLDQANQGPSPRHPFGTDSLLGHDIFSLVLYGGRLSIFIGIGGTLIATAIAILVGAMAGYFGGWLDAILMRIADINYAIPILLTVPLAARVFGHANPVSIAIIFGIFSWAGSSRIVRSYFLSLREQQFTEAARALGVSAWRIVYRHLLPNAVGPILVTFTLGIASIIVLEAFVSFLGYGIQPPDYSWGSILSNAQEYMVQGNWWWVTFPGLAIVATVICINFIGDGLRDALDPKTLR
jgi:peptide/nickel transport system permease protein